MHEPGNGLGPKGATALAPVLKEMKGLTFLGLESECVIWCRSRTTVRNDTQGEPLVVGWGGYGVDTSE